MSFASLRKFLLALLLVVPSVALAALPAAQAPVRYMALGDSLASGYKAMPATAGYAYQLYLGRAFGSIPDVLFSNASVPGARSNEVLNFQLPQAGLFQPNVVTISVGGNDLLALLETPPITPEKLQAALDQFGLNLGQILGGLCLGMPAGGQIYLHNLYEIPDIPETAFGVPAFNQTLNQVVNQMSLFPGCPDKIIGVADVYTAFLGQKGLLLIERYQKKGIDLIEVHPTNKGHRVIEEQFRALLAN